MLGVALWVITLLCIALWVQLMRYVALWVIDIDARCCVVGNNIAVHCIVGSIDAVCCIMGNNHAGCCTVVIPVDSALAELMDGEALYNNGMVRLISLATASAYSCRTLTISSFSSSCLLY